MERNKRQDKGRAGHQGIGYTAVERSMHARDRLRR